MPGCLLRLCSIAGTPQANAARSVPEESGHIVEAHWEYDPETGRSVRALGCWS